MAENDITKNIEPYRPRNVPKNFHQFVYCFITNHSFIIYSRWSNLKINLNNEI